VQLGSTDFNPQLRRRLMINMSEFGLKPPANAADGFDYLCLPLVNAGDRSHHNLIIQATRTGRSGPAAEQHHVDVTAVLVLQAQAGVSDTWACIDIQRECPKRAIF
jgi:hypothetical protein